MSPAEPGRSSAVSTSVTAVEDYHALLAQSELRDESASMLIEEQPRRALTFGGKPLCSVLRPQLLDRATYDRIRAQCSLLSRAMFRLADHLLADPALLETLYLDDAERELIAIDPGYRPVSPTSRLDSFLGPSSWSFVEYNAETPAAIAYEDVLTELFLEMPVVKAFRRTHAMTPLPARDRLLDVLLGAYRARGGQDLPSVAIVDWKGLPTATEFELFARYFAERGIKTLIVEPAELEYDGRRLTAQGVAIDLVYRRVLTAELLSRPDAAAALIKAYREGAVCVVNSFRSKLLHKKLIFALLSDDRYAHLFSPEEQAAIAAHIPWTRRVSDGATSYRERTVDLLPFVEERREHMVLKPNDEYGGKGVVIGWETTPEQWRQALTEALRSPYAVQERVPVGKETFPVWRDGNMVWEELAADLDPFLFHSEVGGVLTRLSSAALLNVTAGTGSLAPTFIVS